MSNREEQYVASLRGWLSPDEKKLREGERYRWRSRFTFGLAALGSMAGLSNIWRFPYLSLKHDGFSLFPPYLVIFFFVGLPLLILELTLGQKFQRGAMGAFRGMHKRFAGVGLISLYASYVVCFYYAVVMAWSVILFFQGFKNPLPWSYNNEDFVARCDRTNTTRVDQFFLVDLTGYADSKCLPYQEDGEGAFQAKTFLSILLVWVLVFAFLSNSVKTASKVVWLTATIPIILLVVQSLKGITLEGADDGLLRYFQGTEDKFASLRGMARVRAKEVEEETSKQLWLDSAGQVLFSTSLCLGVMTSYSSYNVIKKPIIQDSIAIAICNLIVSFVAGVTMWSALGYLSSKGVPLPNQELSQFSFVFGIMPAALEEQIMPNAWVMVFAFTVFIFGIDSLFSLVEGVATSICDSSYGSRFPRKFVIFALCLLGFLGTIPLCTNWGYILLDVLDHYLNHLLLLVGVLECMSCGWAFDSAVQVGKSEEHRKAIQALTMTFWSFLAVFGISFGVVEKMEAGLITMFVFIVAVLYPFGFWVADLSHEEYFNDVWMCGVRKLGYSITMLSRYSRNEKRPWERVFVFLWGTCLKFVAPTFLWFIFVDGLRYDLENPYKGYHQGWQNFGIVLSALGLILFAVMLFVGVHEQPCDQTQFEQEFDELELTSRLENSKAEIPGPEMVECVNILNEKDEEEKHSEKNEALPDGQKIRKSVLKKQNEDPFATVHGQSPSAVASHAHPDLPPASQKLPPIKQAPQAPAQSPLRDFDQQQS